MISLIHKRFPEVEDSEILVAEYLCCLKYKKRMRIPGILYVTEQRICFYSLVFSSIKKMTIRYEDIDTIKKVDKMLLPYGISIIFGQQEIYLIGFIKRESAFQNIQSQLLEVHQSIKTIPQKRSRSKSQCASKISYVPKTLKNGKNPELRSLLKSMIKKSLNNFWEDLQANPIIIFPSSRSGIQLTNGKSKHSVTFSKSKWIPLFQLVDDFSYNLKYQIELKENVKLAFESSNAQGNICILVENISDNQMSLIYEYNFEKGFAPYRIKIQLNATKIDDCLKFEVNYKLDFDNLTPCKSQIRIENDIRKQIKEHFKQVLGALKKNPQPQIVKSISSNISAFKLQCIPKLKNIAMTESILLMLWILLVTGLVSSIMTQKEFKIRSSGRIGGILWDTIRK